MTTITVLHPSEYAGEVIEPDPAEERLTNLYAHPVSGIAWVRANMVTSLDGGAHGIDGSSSNINNAVDMRVFRVIRSVADVVLVGAGTAVRDDYHRLTLPPPLAHARAERGQDELRLAVVTMSGQLDPELLEIPGLIVITGSDRAILDRLRSRLGSDAVISAGDTRVDVTRAVNALAERGMPRIVCEGGPSLLGWALHDFAIDEICLTQSPLMVGGPAGRIVSNDRWLDPPIKAHLVHMLFSDDTFIGRWLINA